MTFNLNFNLEAWVKNLELDAATKEDAIRQLMGMTLADILDEGATVDPDMKITEVDATVIDYTAIVRVSEIEYDFSSEKMDPAVIDYLNNLLPKETTLTIRGVRDTDDLEELVADELEIATNYATKSFKFQVVEQK